ncbi:AzlD family protein [Marinobacter sp.]|uniref:AzlD family protein n=1 Tax=Marinobacter sp. TaxID=50741 RepID=UPI002B4A603F|nr:AzlD domain-containing protein [Marinobacter sp.]HKK57773.1 AzlD domain-containing protein [Marinobacter sp.]
MTIETTMAGTLALIAIITAVTIVTRFGGVFLMSFVTISPRIESFINTMASSVLIAIIVPMAFSGDAGALAALVVTAVIMLATRKPLPAIGAGIAAAGLVRFAGITVF